jgi:hypothetical protein
MSEIYYMVMNNLCYTFVLPSNTVLDMDLWLVDHTLFLLPDL